MSSTLALAYAEANPERSGGASSCRDAAPHKMAGTDEALLPGVVIQAPEQGRRGCPPIDPATKRGYPSTHS